MNTWQDALWAFPNSFGFWWDATWGMLALVASLIMFVKMILNHPFDALLVARSVLAFGLFLVACSAINSGWQRYVPMFFAIGGFMSAMLLATGWCERKNKSTAFLLSLMLRFFRPKGVPAKSRNRPKGVPAKSRNRHPAAF